MKIDVDMIETIGEIIGNAELFRPLVQQAVTTIKSFAPELRSIPEALSDYIVKNRKKNFDLYIAEGFTREEAILLMIDSSASIKKAMSNWENVSKNLNKG